MESQKLGDNSEQIRKYAEDLALLYQQEQAKQEELLRAHRQTIQYASDLGDTLLELKRSHSQLREAYLDTVHRLARATEYKDEDTGAHLLRLSRTSSHLLDRLGGSSFEVENMLYAAPMHDVGKIGIPDSILFKPGRLTPEEFEIMKRHTTIGHNLLSGSNSPILELAARIALTHHERWDGTGYPGGLTGHEIPLAGRITGLMDVFDALTSARPYKQPYPLTKALEILCQGKGSHFDPRVHEAFLAHLEEVLDIHEEINGMSAQEVAFELSERDLAGDRT
jgi:putative two-component system response regulator